MSDTSQGEGWWLASDSKWYPPQSTPAPPPPPPPHGGKPSGGNGKHDAGKREVALAAAGLIVVGSFLPWAKATTIFGDMTISGFDAGDGKFTALLGALACAALFAGWHVVARIAGVLAAAIGIHDMVDIEKVTDEDVFRVASSYGIWMVIVGGLVVLVQPTLSRRAKPPPAPHGASD